TDPSAAGKATDFVLTFPQTSYSVQAVRLTVDTGHAADTWEEIDAVRLLTGGSPSGVGLGTYAADQAPVGADDWAEANEGTAVSVPVLQNDSDPDGDPLTVAATTA